MAVRVEPVQSMGVGLPTPGSEKCDRMDHMIRELLSLSALESGIFETNITIFDLSGIVRTAENRFSLALAENGITLTTSCETVTVGADSELLGRAISNFLSNAIDHVRGEKRIEVDVRPVDGWARVSVFNTGDHIPEEVIGSVWDVFFKVDKARTRRYGGHGLGLSIVKSIAEIHQGRVGVTNVPGGVRFWMEIPQESVQGA